MKCAIVLLALVAVSQAAFTSKLSQRAHPILSDAITKMHSAVGRSSFREGEVTNSIIDALQVHADNLLNQIDSAVQTGQAVAASLVEQFQETVAQLQALGANVHAGASGILSNLLASLGGIFGGLFGGKSGVVGQTIIDLVNQWNLDHHISNALNSNIAQWIATAINSLGMSPLLQNAITTVLGEDLANYILGHFNAGGKGLFDGISSVASSLTAAAQQALANIGNTISQIVAVASSNFEQLQQIATQFAQEALAQAATTASEAAQQFLDFIKPYQQDLGALYEQVVAQVSTIIG